MGREFINLGTPASSATPTRPSRIAKSRRRPAIGTGGSGSTTPSRRAQPRRALSTCPCRSAGCCSGPAGIGRPLDRWRPRTPHAPRARSLAWRKASLVRLRRRPSPGDRWPASLRSPCQRLGEHAAQRIGVLRVAVNRIEPVQRQPDLDRRPLVGLVGQAGRLDPRRGRLSEGDGHRPSPLAHLERRPSGEDRGCGQDEDGDELHPVAPLVNALLGSLGRSPRLHQSSRPASLGDHQHLR
jgi:hypothetical protein